MTTVETCIHRHRKVRRYEHGSQLGAFVFTHWRAHARNVAILNVLRGAAP